jgi:hypothetical protein
MPPEIISIDDFKEKIDGYSPERASEFHFASAKMADAEFDKTLKNPKSPAKVIFLAGGSASGKTEYIHTFLTSDDAIIFDSTFSTSNGAKIKIDKAKKGGKEIEIHFVIPDDLKRAFIAFLGRLRKFDDLIFYQTHSNSRSTLKWVIQNYSDVTIKIIESSYVKNNLVFTEIGFKNKKDFADHVDFIQLSIDDIVKKVTL